MNTPEHHDLSSSQQRGDAALLVQVQKDLETLLSRDLTSQDDRALIPLWSSRTSDALKRLVTSNGSLDVHALRHFRRDQILVDDVPSCDLGRNPLKSNAARNLLGGGRRGARNCLLECLRVLRAQGFDDLLRRYPCLPVGNPYIFRYRGYHYTWRWTRHIYFLGLMNSILRDRLREDFVVLDIGSSYGIFSGLVKKEYPASRHVLVDVPEQLILARYFLGSWFPEARIVGVTELLHEPAITRDVISDYDFMLLPVSLFDRLSAQSADLITNFASFTEMTRVYFERYMRSDVFRSSRYFYTINRIEAYPKEERTDVSILDFPITDSEKRLHFGICPIFSVNYRFYRRLLFFTSYRDPPPYFEYIGQM